MKTPLSWAKLKATSAVEEQEAMMRLMCVAPLSHFQPPLQRLMVEELERRKAFFERSSRADQTNMTLAVRSLTDDYIMGRLG